MGSQESQLQPQPYLDQLPASNPKQQNTLSPFVTPIKENKLMDSRVNESRNTIADSILKLGLQNKIDSNVTSKLVQSRLNNLPMSSARVSKYDNGEMIKHEQAYDQYLKAKFIGEKVNGKPHGFGKLYFENDDYLQGTFVNGRCEGQGRIIRADGSYYQGQIINNQADGHGKYIDVNGYKYEGQWKNNMPNGTGQAIYQDGSRYIGQFLNNKRNGKGMYISNGDIFQGNFLDDKIDGFCVYAGKNGERFEGQWVKGMKEGYGKYYWPDGKRYQGQYKFDHRHGKGILYYSEKQKYSGQWENGYKQGQGVYQTQNQKMNGLWVKGNLSQIIK